MYLPFFSENVVWRFSWRWPQYPVSWVAASQSLSAKSHNNQENPHAFYVCSSVVHSSSFVSLRCQLTFPFSHVCSFSFPPWTLLFSLHVNLHLIWYATGVLGQEKILWLAKWSHSVGQRAMVLWFLMKVDQTYLCTFQSEYFFYYDLTVKVSVLIFYPCQIIFILQHRRRVCTSARWSGTVQALSNPT